MEGLEEGLTLAREYARKMFRKSKAPPSHGYDHVVRVVGLCRWISRELGMERRERLMVEVAAWLHDVSIAITGSKDDHASKSARVAERLLSGVIERPFLEIIVRAIEEHSWRAGRNPSSTVSAVLQDADRLDALGSVGIFRVIVYGASSGRVFYDLDDPFAERRALDDEAYTVDHFYVKLFKLPKYMNTEVARKEAYRRIEVMKSFLEELRRELSLT